MQRSLAAILTADVVGYSRLMGRDEAGTLVELQRHRDEIFDPKAAQHHGRTVKLMGDGTLMEFASVVDAVTFAVDLQIAMAERNAGIAQDRQIIYRIGINLGDIVHQDDDIFGDGVNVAARLEALAEPGGICISRSARDQVRDKLDVSLDDLGEIEVKNIARPVRVFRVLIDNKAAALATPVVATARPLEVSRKPFYAAVLAASIVLLAGLAWWQPWSPKVETASVARMALPLPDKPSIAVLPFTNMSDDPGQEYFTDGMTDDLITDLSKVSGLFVIARNSTFVYKGKPVNVKEVAEQLGVRHVLEGSVRRSGNQLRVNAQLIDAITGGHLWAERYDGKATDIFAAQDEFVLKIVEALTVKLTDTEKSEIEKVDTRKIAARESFQKGWELYSKFNPHDNAKSVVHFEKAIELDPEYGRAYGALAMVNARIRYLEWYRAMGFHSAPFAMDALIANLKKARQHPTALAHAVASWIHLTRGTDGAKAEAARAIALQPNDPEAHISMALVLITTGEPAEGLSFVKAAMRLNPNHTSYYTFLNAAAHYALGDLKQAAEILKEGISENPSATELAPLAASVFAELGERQEARKTIESWWPGLTEEELQKEAGSYRAPINWLDAQLKTRLLDGLRLAALPLDVTIASLISVLSKGSPDERAGAVRALGWFGAQARPAVGNLIELLGSKHKIVRKEAIIALGKIGPNAKAAVPALTAISGKPLIGFHAKKALEKINGE